MNIKTHFPIATAFVAAALLFSSRSTVYAAGTVSNQFAASFVVNEFTWTEDIRDLSLEENGTLIGLRFDARVPIGEKWNLFFDGDLYAGTVDYDGFLINVDGSTRPYQSETQYGGLGGNMDFGYDLLPDSAFGLYPFLGGGFDYWLRSLDDSEGFGYDEYWLTMYGRVGLRVFWHSSPSIEWFALGALLLPFYNYEWAVDVPLADDDEIELEPKEKAGYTFEAGANIQRLQIAVFHERMEFGASDLDDSGRFLQPDSTREITGVRVGLRF